MAKIIERATARKAAPNKASARREQIKRLSDFDLAALRRDLEAETRRRSKETIEGIHGHDPAYRIRCWPPCPICHSRSCRSQSCRDVERRIARCSR
jgi:hypothetical protein